MTRGPTRYDRYRPRLVPVRYAGSRSRHKLFGLSNQGLRVGIKTDGKSPRPFPYPRFFIENGIESGIVGNENGSGINEIVKTNGNENTNGNL
jgi:hypothetical protein